MHTQRISYLLRQYLDNNLTHEEAEEWQRILLDDRSPPSGKQWSVTLPVNRACRNIILPNGIRCWKRSGQGHMP
jgi:hypothetical protein